MSHPIFADDMREIVESFVIETQEIFESLDNDLLELEQRPNDRTLIDQIFRAVHTVKGTSGFLSLEQLSLLSHHFEDVLNRLRRQELDFRPEMMDVMFAAFDLMKVLLQQVLDQRLEPIDLDETIAALNAISAGTFTAPEAPSPAAAAPETPAADTPAPEQPETPKAAAAPEEAVNAPAAIDADERTAAAEQASPQAEGEPAEADADERAPQQPEATGPRRKSEVAETIRVEVDRLDSLLNLVGELVLGRNRLLQLVSDASLGNTGDDLLHDLSDTTAQIDFITTELQTAIMRTRMIQIGRVFNKFPRVVRDLAREFGKQIDLVIEGEETELDKSLVEEIGDPLVHLIRNAADHGIEQPDVRLAQGKPAQGRLRLAAAHEGNHIVIVIEDDGAGMDPEKLKKKAVEKNLISAKEAAEMSDAEAFNLIFQAGFSTAERVSKVSGRGVGMDVVKTNITRLNGTISIESELGRGTRFTLRLPLTLAIIQSLLVRVGEETYALPLHAVIEVVGLDEQNVSTIKGREVLRLREQVLPLLSVGDVLSAGTRQDGARRYAVVVGVAHHALGLVVDDLIGQKEIVIKPLGSYLKKIPGLAGSTILGDGRVIMILDVGEIVRMENDRMKTAA